MSACDVRGHLHLCVLVAHCAQYHLCLPEQKLLDCCGNFLPLSGDKVKMGIRLFFMPVPLCCFFGISGSDLCRGDYTLN